MKTLTRNEGDERMWIIDGIIEMPDEALIELARDYGYGGKCPEEAAKVIRVWQYEVAICE